MWQATLGVVALRLPQQGLPAGETVATARRIAVHVERVATRLPFATKCLHRAMALAWMLRSRGINFKLKIAVRPPEARTGTHDLHAWVEAGGMIVLGDLPEPWAVLLVLVGRA